MKEKDVDKPANPSNPTAPNNTKLTTNQGNAQTGDTTSLAVLWAMVLWAGALATFSIAKKRKKQQ